MSAARSGDWANKKLVTASQWIGHSGPGRIKNKQVEILALLLSLFDSSSKDKIIRYVQLSVIEHVQDL